MPHNNSTFWVLLLEGKKF